MIECDYCHVRKSPEWIQATDYVKGHADVHFCSWEHARLWFAEHPELSKPSAKPDVSTWEYDEFTTSGETLQPPL